MHCQVIEWCTNKLDLISPNVFVCRDCQENKPVWMTLHLYELINLDEILNVSKVSFLSFIRASQGLQKYDSEVEQMSCSRGKWRISGFIVACNHLRCLCPSHSTQRGSRSSLRTRISHCPPSLSSALKLKTSSVASPPRPMVWTPRPSHSR